MVKLEIRVTTGAGSIQTVTRTSPTERTTAHQKPVKEFHLIRCNTTYIWLVRICTTIIPRSPGLYKSKLMVPPHMINKSPRGCHSTTTSKIYWHCGIIKKGEFSVLLMFCLMFLLSGSTFPHSASLLYISYSPNPFSQIHELAFREKLMDLFT